jgi:uncharacterized membrane protein YphA (DoxX/SURF4 family)
MNERGCRQIRLITRIIALGCLSGMLLCFGLWRSTRNFPLSPVFSTSEIPAPYDLIFPVLAFSALLLIILLKNPQKIILLFLIAALFLALTDMNRWQPWFYQYVLMFFILVFFNYRCDDVRHQDSILRLFRLMIAAIYFWSGLQKLNPNFEADTLPWLLEPLVSEPGTTSAGTLKLLAGLIPLIEVGSGILLLLPRLQRTGMYCAVGMHLLILYILSPLGHNYNPVVWPWNITMIALNIILFFPERGASSIGYREMLRFHSIKIVTLLFVLMPLLNFFNRWDSYLSHNLYSGNTSNGSVFITDSVAAALPANIRPYAIGEQDEKQINIKYWCMQETGVPAYPEQRNFERVAGFLQKYSTDKKDVFLLYVPKLKAGRR